MANDAAVEAYMDANERNQWEILSAMGFENSLTCPHITI